MGLQAAFWENTSRNKRVVIYASSNCGLPNKKTWCKHPVLQWKNFIAYSNCDHKGCKILAHENVDPYDHMAISRIHMNWFCSGSRWIWSTKRLWSRSCSGHTLDNTRLGRSAMMVSKRPTTCRGGSNWPLGVPMIGSTRRQIQLRFRHPHVRFFFKLEVLTADPSMMLLCSLRCL